MDIGKSFKAALTRKIQRNWEKIYVIVDIHDTIIHASYENVGRFPLFPSHRGAPLG